MGFLGDLSLVGGTGMIATALGMLGRDWYLLGRTCGGLREARAHPIRGDWRGRLALVLLAWGPIFLAIGFAALGEGSR